MNEIPKQQLLGEAFLSPLERVKKVALLAPVVDAGINTVTCSFDDHNKVTFIVSEREAEMVGGLVREANDVTIKALSIPIPRSHKRLVLGVTASDEVTREDIILWLKDVFLGEFGGSIEGLGGDIDDPMNLKIVVFSGGKHRRITAYKLQKHFEDMRKKGERGSRIRRTKPLGVPGKGSTFMLRSQDVLPATVEEHEAIIGKEF